MNVLLALFLALAPTVKAENARFNIHQDGKRIGTEDFSITPRGSGYTASGRTRISVGNQDLDLRSRMELDEQLRPTYYEVESKGNLIRLKVEQPLSELEYSLEGKAKSQDVRFPSDGAILDENFFHHYLILLYRSGIAGTSVPTLVPQQMTMGVLTVRSMGVRTFEIETSNVKLIATTDADGRLLRLTVPDAKVVIER